MTYCVAMRLAEGMVFAADSRTNAGVDRVAVFRKMHLFERRGERSMVLLSAGNLATSQHVVSSLCKQAQDHQQTSLYTISSMFEAAELVGDTLRGSVQRFSEAPNTTEGNAGVDFSASFIFGGQIGGEAPRLFNIYPQGNFIEATEDTPYFQIGESKYGKPIIDRIINFDTSLNHAMKCVLLSFDSTIRSNLSVGMPIDFVSYREDSFDTRIERIEEDDDYFNQLRAAWGQGMRRLFEELP